MVTTKNPKKKNAPLLSTPTKSKQSPASTPTKSKKPSSAGSSKAKTICGATSKAGNIRGATSKAKTIHGAKKSPDSPATSATSATSASTVKTARSLTSRSDAGSKATPSKRAASKLSKLKVSSDTSPLKKGRACKNFKIDNACSNDGHETDGSETDPPEAMDIEWSEKKSVNSALTKLVKDTSKWKGRSHREKLEVLCECFQPSDIKVVMGILATKMHLDPSKLGLKKLKTKKQLAPPFVDLVVKYMNSKTDLQRIPGNIVIK